MLQNADILLETVAVYSVRESGHCCYRTDAIMIQHGMPAVHLFASRLDVVIHAYLITTVQIYTAHSVMLQENIVNQVVSLVSFILGFVCNNILSAVIAVISLSHFHQFEAFILQIRSIEHDVDHDVTVTNYFFE